MVACLAIVLCKIISKTSDYNSLFHHFLQKDSLMDLSFHVPTSNTQFLGDEERPSAHVSSLDKHDTTQHACIFCANSEMFSLQIFWQKILAIADVGSSEEAVVSLEGIAILTPR